MAGYYEVTYDPQLTAFDGAFRRVSVKVKRPGVSVQSREGYFALPPGEGSVDFPWELPLLKALEVVPRAARLRDPRRRLPLRPGAGRGAPHPRGRDPARRARVRGRGRDAQGALLGPRGGARRPGCVREHFSQDSPVEVPEKDLEALRRGNAVFSRSFTVPPGRYALELVVLDQVAKRASVRKSVLVVRPGAPGARCCRASRSSSGPSPSPRARSSRRTPCGTARTASCPSWASPRSRPGETVSLFLVAYPAGTGRRASPWSSRATARWSAARPSSCPPPTRPAGSPTWRACRRRASRPGATRSRPW